MSQRNPPDPLERLTRESLRERHAALAARVAEADAAPRADAWLALFDDWNAVKASVRSEASRRRLRFDADTRDEAAEAAFNEFRRELKPAAEAMDSELSAALLASPHAEAVGAERGRRLLQLARLEQTRLDPVNSDLRVQTGDVAQEWDRLVSSAEVTVGGKTMTLPRARALSSSPDAATRREAFLAWRGWFRDQRDELQDIYGRLVALRHEMGRRVGDETFVPLGYAGMSRTDYGPDEVRGFREAVRRHVAPLHAALSRQQADDMGTDGLAPWDAGHDPRGSLPDDAGEPVATQVERAQGAFDALSPELAEHFRTMRRRNLIDLENRPGKRPGAYCTQIPDEGAVAIFCNSVGSADDVRTLVHETGHAFQGWESQWIQPVDLRLPSLDAAEVHSMGMELLIQPHLDHVLDPAHLPAYRRTGWRRGVAILCYGSVVDAFQHFVYENPGASPDERDAEWNRLSAELTPGVDWTGHEPLLAARWLAQLHVFHHPFYYIDYAIAQCGALQLARLDQVDHDAALSAYRELCRLGGTRGVLELFEGAGLKSPLDPAVVEDLAGFLAGELEIEPAAA